MSQDAKRWHYEVLAQKAVEALKRNNFGAVYARDSAEACRAIMSMVPDGATIGFGGSVTAPAIGVLDLLKAGPYQLVNPPWVERSMTREDRNALRRRAMLVDVFLTGTNAVTLDGKLVNTDATANRVAGMLFGPKKTIVIAGANKIVRTVDEALDRVANVAAPLNARRLGLDTPCAITGECNDCRSPQRICNATVILHRKTGGTDLTVVMIGEEMGF